MYFFGIPATTPDSIPTSFLPRMILKKPVNAISIKWHPLNTTTVVAFLTAVTPVCVPRVGHQPVWSIILHTPAENTDSMPTQHGTRLVLIHTCQSTRVDTTLVQVKDFVTYLTCKKESRCTLSWFPLLDHWSWSPSEYSPHSQKWSGHHCQSACRPYRRQNNHLRTS